MVNKLHARVGVTMSFLVLLGLAAWPSHAAADEDVKPVAVLSIASIDRLMDDMAYLGRAAGRSDAGIAFQLMSGPFVESFDRTRPAGVLITIENDEPKGIGFLPVPDSNKLLNTFKDKVGAEIDDLGNGIKKLEMGKGAYLKQQGEWLYFTDHPRHLSRLPEDPVAQLDGLDKKYTIALRFYVRNIPQGMKDVADFTLQNKVDADLKMVELSNPELDAALVDSFRKSGKQWVSSLINDSDQITVGWAVDPPQRRTYVDLRAQAKDGSTLSDQFAAMLDSRSTFTGFFQDNAAAAFQGSMRVSDQSKEQISAFLDYVKERAEKGIEADPNAPASLTPIVNSVLDVVKRTVQEGKTDAGATLLLAPESFKFVGGLRVADGRALAEAFEDLFQLAKNEPNVPEVNFYAEKYGDLDLHTLILPIDENDKDARRLLGETVDIAIATGPEQLYFALGEGSDGLLKAIVDKSQEIGEAKIPPIQVRIAVKPIMQFLASIDRDNEKQQALAEAISQASGGDAIQLTVEQIDNGFGCRLIIEEGLLELAGKASQYRNGG